LEIVYFSNYSGNTKKFVDKLAFEAHRIPIKWSDDEPLLVTKDYVLFVPTYGGGNEGYSVPRQVVKFLNVPSNREHIRGVVGLGNTNFGEHYCRAAEIVSAKTGVPLLYRVEITGTSDDIQQVTERMTKLWTANTATMN
jgi:protein involved in ribonucleotide reduction